MHIFKFTILAMALCLLAAGPVSADTSKYQDMPDFVKKIMNVPMPPKAKPSPDGKNLLLTHYGRLPSVEELARPTVGLAGIAIDPKSNSKRPMDLGVAIEIYNIKSGLSRTVENLPEESRIGHISWSPKGKYIAMTLYGEAGLELWVADLESLQAQRLSELYLNDILGKPYEWHNDGRSIIALTVPLERGPRPEVSKHKFGPRVRDSDGQARPARTYQNLLQSGYDIMLFEYLAKSCITRIRLDGKHNTVAAPDLYKRISPSPSAGYLLTETIHPPYSFYFPAGRFPFRVEVMDLNGEKVHKVDDLPLAFRTPPGKLSVRTGARSSAWNPAKPAELWWVNALDEGNPEKRVQFRDELFSISAPFDSPPSSRFRIPARFRRMYWASEEFAIISATDTSSGSTEYWIVNPENKESIIHDPLPGAEEYGAGNLKPRISSSEGDFKQCMLSPDGESIYLEGFNTVPFPEKKILLSLSMESKTLKPGWIGTEKVKERVIMPVSGDKALWIVRGESFEDPRNYYYRDGQNWPIKPLTNFIHPVPEVSTIQKMRLEYKREDGVPLAADLYLPPGYKVQDGPLPVLLWIYPREYKNTEAAAKAIKESSAFIPLGRKSRMFWPLLGYALMDSPTMPIIGSGESQPNDTFLSQMRMNAKAAVDELVRIGVASPEKIAVGGHSYGAFATANLLTHTDLFAAGIARSGAYNRSLTPFGFQREHRTFWTEPELYEKVSPFFHISKIKSPILLIHGEHDQNSGTYPEQSERYYRALVGLGKKARLVMLPYENHSYYGRESVMHMIWEMERWLDLNLKKGKEQEQTEKRQSGNGP